MKIESLIIRAGGSKIDLPAPDTQYHFKPSDTDPRHIAEVENKSHIAILLRIPEGYAAVDADDDELPPPVELNGSVVHNASYPIHGGDDIALDDLVKTAFEQSALRVEEWNKLEDEARYEYIDNTLADLQFDPTKPVVEEKPPVPPELQAADVTVEQVDGSQQPAPAETGEQSEPAPAPAEKVEEPAEPAAEQTREELEEAYKAKFGRKPSSQMKDSNILKAISEDDDE